MRKVINSLILFLLPIQCIVGQNINTDKISGNYKFTEDDVYRELRLYKNGNFHEKDYSGLLSEDLYGQWTLRKNKLILSYNLPKKSENSKYIQNYCEIENMSDSVFIYTYNHNLRPISYEASRLCFINIDGTKEYQKRIGENLYVVNKSEIPEKVSIYVTGYPVIDVNFRKGKGNCIHLYLVEDTRFHFRKRKYNIEDGLIIVNDYIKMEKQDE